MNRFHIADVRLAREKAKSLKSLAAQVGRNITLSECRETIATLYGYRDWAEMLRVTERGAEPSPVSDIVENGEIAIVAESLAIGSHLASFVLESLCPRMPGMHRRVEGRLLVLGEDRRLFVRDGERQDPQSTHTNGTSGSDIRQFPSQARQISEHLLECLVGEDGALSTVGRQEVGKQFAAQTGARWSGLADQPPHLRLLFALLAVHGLRGREESAPLFRAAAELMSRPIMVRREKIEEMAARYLEDSEVREFIDEVATRHAYVGTVVMGVLEECRARGGLLAAAEVLWLKECDQKAWNALIAAGGRISLYRTVGVMAHYQAEQEAGEAIHTVRADRAIDGLESWLRDQAKERSIAGRYPDLRPEDFRKVDRPSP